jgi:hypothetical protein
MVQPKANGLADPPADSIAHDGAAQRAARQADARTVRLLPADAERREQGARVAVALIVNPAEVFDRKIRTRFEIPRFCYLRS